VLHSDHAVDMEFQLTQTGGQNIVVFKVKLGDAHSHSGLCWSWLHRYFILCVINTL